MARTTFGSLKEAIAAQGPVATVPSPKTEKPKKEAEKPKASAIPMPVMPSKKDRKKAKKAKANRPAPEKQIRYAPVEGVRIKPEGVRDVSKPDLMGTSEIGKFKTTLDTLGLELHGCEVRRKKTFADEFFNDATDTPTQRALIKEYQGLYDSKFRATV